jgi:DNA-binding transcriptional LysR family regulator
MDMNIQKYVAFVKAVEYGSFTKAAEALSYSQSGISRMIRDLEDEWHIALLERDRSGIRLTSDGVRLLPYAAKVCQEFQKLQAQVDRLKGLESGLIRIGTISSVATHWLPNVIKAFHKDYPHIDYELKLGDYDEIEEWIVKGQVDCGFIRLPAHKPLDTVFLEEDPFLAVLPENHPLTDYDAVPIHALENWPFLLLKKTCQGDVSDLFEQYDITPDIHFTTWDDYAIMSMVESGLGISILPKLILKRIPYHIVLRRLDVPAFRNIGMALRDKKNAPLSVQRFIGYVSYR